MTWQLLDRYYLAGLDDQRCLWMPHPSAATVRRDPQGGWRADWNDDVVDPGPPSTIAWLTWHIQWWLGDAIAELRGEPAPDRAAVRWPGSVDGVCEMNYAGSTASGGTY